MAALRPWARRLTVAALRRGLTRGLIGALALGSVVLAVGWVMPWPESELRPWAAELALPVLVVALVIAARPVRMVRRAAELDVRLGFGDRLATAWIYRDALQPIMQLQRGDAIARLIQPSVASDLRWRPSRVELWALATGAVLAAVLLLTPSPMQRVLDRQAAEQEAVAQAAIRLEALREEATGVTSLTPDQARRLDELLQQAQAELSRTRTQQEARTVLARTGQQLADLNDPSADAREEALAAMSETLTAEPLSRALGEALQHEDTRGAEEAMQALAQQTDRLTDAQRQALSRALQRAANVGRADPRSSAALREAARAVAAGDSTDTALKSAEAALRDAIQSAMGQEYLRVTTQRVRDMQTQLSDGRRLDEEAARGSGEQKGFGAGAPAIGTPVAIDAATGRLRDPTAERGPSGGIARGDLSGLPQPLSGGTPSENVFVPGRAGTGVGDQDLIDQTFSVRGEPRPYREVLAEYAQNGRDSVDRPDVSPAVRDLVKQYFQQLEEGR